MPPELRTGGEHEFNEGFTKEETMKNKEERKYRINRKGFTLIELLVVMVILAMLAAIVGPKLFGKVGKGKQSAAKTQIEMLGQALRQLPPGHRSLSYNIRGPEGT